MVIELKNFAECVMILCSFLFSAFVHQNSCHKIFEDYPLIFSPLQLPGPCCNISLSAESEDRLCSVTASIPLSLDIVDIVDIYLDIYCCNISLSAESDSAV